MKYLINGYRVINGDHIVDVFYDDANSGIDYETGEPFKNTSRCTIKLDSVHLEQHTVYDGDTDGTASESDKVVLRDKWADRFWQAYSGDAYAV